MLDICHEAFETKHFKILTALGLQGSSYAAFDVCFLPAFLLASFVVCFCSNSLFGSKDGPFGFKIAPCLVLVFSKIPAELVMEGEVLHRLLNPRSKPDDLRTKVTAYSTLLSSMLQWFCG